jgi:sarcosine oxidase, subunit gamma
MADIVSRHSPLAGRSGELAGLPIGARELPFLTQLNVRLDATSPAANAVAAVLGGPLPTVPCTASRFGEFEVLWLGPDEWLVLAPPGRETSLAAGLREAVGSRDGAVTDVSAERVALELTGAYVRELLARGCSIDLHPKVTPIGSCVQTLLARTGVVIVVHDDSASHFLVLVRASFADYLASWLIDACTEVG